MQLMCQGYLPAFVSAQGFSNGSKKHYSLCNVVHGLYENM